MHSSVFSLLLCASFHQICDQIFSFAHHLATCLFWQVVHQVTNQQTNDLSSKGHLHTATSPFLPDCSAFRGDANHPSANGHSSTASNNSNHQISHLILTCRTDSNVFTSNHLNNQSQYSNEIRLNDRPNKEFATSAHLTPRTMCLQAVRENRFPT